MWPRAVELKTMSDKTTINATCESELPAETLLSMQDTLKNIITTSISHSSSSNELIDDVSDDSLPVDNRDVSLAIANRMEINWCDKNELTRKSDLLDSDQRRMLKVLDTKQRDFSDGLDDKYFSNALPILASGVKMYQSLVCCGQRINGVERPCEKPMFCSRCAKRLGHAANAMYGSCFSSGTFHFVTISFKGTLPYDSVHSPLVTEYWDAVDGAFEHLYRQDMIDGIYWVNEISIHQFQPLRILPHGHAVIDSGVFTDEHTDLIKEFFQERYPDIELEISIVSDRLDSKHDLYRIVDYCNKPIDLAEPYQTAVAYMQGEQRMESLNREMREFLEGIPTETFKRKRIHRLGTMSPQCRTRYIGTSKSERVAVVKRAGRKAHEAAQKAAVQKTRAS